MKCMSAFCPALSALLSALGSCLSTCKYTGIYFVSALYALSVTYYACACLVSLTTHHPYKYFRKKLSSKKGGQDGQTLKAVDFKKKEAVRLENYRADKGGQGRTEQVMLFAGTPWNICIAGSKRAGKGAEWFVKSRGISERVN